MVRDITRLQRRRWIHMAVVTEHRPRECNSSSETPQFTLNTRRQLRLGARVHAL